MTLYHLMKNSAMGGPIPSLLKDVIEDCPSRVKQENSQTKGHLFHNGLSFQRRMITLSGPSPLHVFPLLFDIDNIFDHMPSPTISFLDYTSLMSYH